QKPRSEAWVAALFLDLTDADTGEKGDYTEYPGRYVAEVFKSCEVRNEYKMPGLLPNVYIWWDRTNVCNIVWCLENYIHPVFHDSVFPGIRRPVDVKEKATEPPDWYRPSGSRT
ncbi:MAG: hypothetical protein J4F34_07530, partial [Gemmatimonadetes bacterium]|nr:hypothetical protein [Gemmatimonadota bacterium]